MRTQCSSLIVSALIAATWVGVGMTPPAQASSALHWPFSHTHKRTSHKKPVHRHIQGYVSQTDNRSQFDKAFDQLVAAAKSHNRDYRRYQYAADRFAKRPRRVMTRLADTLDYTLMYRGVSPSSEAGDVILSEKNKVKGFASARYAQQRIADDLNLKLTTLTLQLAAENDRHTANGTASGGTAYEQLAKLAGAPAATKMKQAILQLPTATAVSSHPSAIWSVTQLQSITEKATSAAARRDPITAEVRSDLGHFAYHKKGTEKTQKTVRVALSAASLAPSVIGPACQATLFGFLAVTGGPEHTKLLNELYLGKRLASRAQLLSKETHLSLETYEQGLMTGNAAMTACAKQMIAHLAGAKTAQSLLANKPTPAVAASKSGTH